MERTGVWLIGARGSIATVTLAGHAAILRGLQPPLGLVTEREVLGPAELIGLDALVFGGHEIRRGRLNDRAQSILDGCGVPYLAAAVRDELEAVDAHIRPGIRCGQGDGVDAFAQGARRTASDREAIDLVRADLDRFRAEHDLARLVVINVASTEPPATPVQAWQSLEALQRALSAGDRVLPDSALYAFAALDGGDAYINFTPSLGSRLPALAELAIARGAVHAGSDGKTGETLVKGVLSELFVRRNLPVLSWFGQNILGNDDGLVLKDPRNKASKIRTKDKTLKGALAYEPETHVGIDYVRSLGEWKIAWDHVHFQGFLGGKMQLQFVWSGCDSLLAAPLVLDLARLTDLAMRRGERGVLSVLAPFFKDPMGNDEQRLVAQDEALLAWALG